MARCDFLLPRSGRRCSRESEAHSALCWQHRYSRDAAAPTASPTAVVRSTPSAPHVDTTPNYVELFRLKFAVINDRMRMIQHMALEQRGRIFVRHVHSVAELFGSAHFAKIESIAGKIADDVHQWRLQGALSDHGLIFYEQYRQQMEERLEDLQETIRRRRPTLWESTAEVIVGFAQRVMSAIPAVDTLSRLISGPAPTRLLLSGRSGKA